MNVIVKTSNSGMTAASSRPREFKIDVIETMQDMEHLRQGWEDLQTRDPESGLFLSWAWMARAFAQNPRRWRVFAVRIGLTYVCIFPTKYRVHWSTSRKELQSEIEAGGRLLWSEYTGFLCDPFYQEPALAALAGHLATLPWSQISIRYEPSQERARLFTSAFPDSDFQVKFKDYRINKGETDNLVSPQIQLPRSFEAYLQASLSKSMREKIRRAFRRHLDTDELRITEATSETFERNVERLLEFWTEKWVEDKGSKAAEAVAGNYRTILRTALDMDLLFMPVLWKGDRPLAALGHIVDLEKRQVHFIVAGRDMSSEISSVGQILHAYSIRWAIDCGFAVYDFCHGNEPYKYSYGAQDKPLNYFTVRKDPKEPNGGSLDPINTAEALHRAIGLIDSGKTAEASAACRQILFDCL